MALLVCATAMYDPYGAAEIVEQVDQHMLRTALAEFLLTPPEERRDWLMAKAASHEPGSLVGQGRWHWSGL